MTADSSGDRPRLISLKDTPKGFRIALVEELGYKVEDNHIVTKDGTKYHDPCSGAEVSIENMMVLPGHSPPVILDDSPLSIAWYIQNYGDIF